MAKVLCLFILKSKKLLIEIETLEVVVQFCSRVVCYRKICKKNLVYKTLIRVSRQFQKKSIHQKH
jgi:hypothetical protein